ncbi:alpha-L-fucosidase [Haoranjiania flava]|uniref:alpha-L-fucosidase n=1 Tax=Haoranjiania flava TaxID=1856322 RepID=A0AAE3IP64_9BACT|nr:alpha-L-fucosidase [Haoranjiania flava]MCU7694745.1 alpha-L-fucosidase [Haoranjiania flava]
MIKKIFIAVACFVTMSVSKAQYVKDTKPYLPSAENLEARKWFTGNKFGLFIHWGLYSILGDGEWVMNNKNITVKNYERLQHFFNPINFNARQWVDMARNAGMRYITLVTRHHDGFSMWDTKESDFSIMHTPYKKDIVKALADECHKQGIRLFLYYSILDWRRDDYSYWTGRTGKGTGRTTRGEWKDYIQFMKNQLTELLTNYGEIGGIWLDGYWDQMPEESATRKDDDVFIDWHMREIYDHIHQLQPQCLIGNNHHLTPLPGEDFQMFERDVPGENAHGLSFQQISKLPLETCATINNSWGFDIKDTAYKSLSEVINLLVRSAGHGGNLLLNIGPMPNGDIQPEFVKTLHETGKWLAKYGETIYNTTGGYLKPQPWGCITETKDKMYLHVLQAGAQITLPSFPLKKMKKVYMFDSKTSVPAILKNGSLSIQLPEQPLQGRPDIIVVIEK